MQLEDFLHGGTYAPKVGMCIGCKKCYGEMKPSKAIVTRASGMGDFSKHDVVTMSPDPRQPVLVDVLKCINCGWSVSEPNAKMQNLQD